MEIITKIQQKYKGVRRIEKRPLIAKKQLTNYPENYVHRVKINDYDNYWRIGSKCYGQFRKYKLIYQ